MARPLTLEAATSENFRFGINLHAPNIGFWQKLAGRDHGPHERPSILDRHP